MIFALVLSVEVTGADFTFGTPTEIGIQACGKLTAWGLNDHGQCNVPRGNDFVAVSGGHWHSLALRVDGSLVSWGSTSETPSGNDFVAIASGSGHNLALKADGSLTAWGGTAYGKTEVPEGNDFVAIAARTEHNLALKADGSIAAWGLNNWGQCDVPEGNDFIAISAGHSHSVAQKADGSLVSWGELTEVPPGNDFVAISAGPMHNLALRADGSIASAGGNSQWDENNVPAGNDFIKVATGSWHCLAIKADGSVVAWGRNLHGECDVPRALSSRIKSEVVAIAGAEGFHSLAVVAAQPAWQGLYFNDFESIVGAEWSNGKTDVTPAARARGFLGQFGDENVILTLSDLPAHTQATVSFDLFILRSWDGNNQIHGPDIWQLKVDGGPTLLHTTFANAPVNFEDFRQAYPDDYPGGDYPPYTGATEIKTLGYTDAPDSVYHLRYTFDHIASIMSLDFSGQGLQEIKDESWGLDNVEVMILSALDFNGEQTVPEHIISLTIDGRSEIVFNRMADRSEDRIAMQVNHISWSKPSNLIIDNTPIDLIWEGNTSQQIPLALAGEFWVRKSQGRDGGYAIQTYEAFLLACVDNPNGADNYVFELYSGPSEISAEWMRVNANGGLPIGCFDLTGMTGFVDGLSYGSKIEFSARIDGSEEFIFSNGNLVIKHLNWNKPVDFYIDEQPVFLTWTDNYSQQIPIALPDKFRVIQTDGRRTIYPVETAAGLVLSVADENNGADLYSWKIATGL